MFDGRLIMHEHNDDLQSLVQAETGRLRDIFGDTCAPLTKVIDAAAAAHARRVYAERKWAEDRRPDSPWLKVARDALRDYQAALRLLLKHADTEVARDIFASIGRE
jgi:hypothetical protein